MFQAPCRGMEVDLFLEQTKELPVVRVSVRQLVEFVLRSGDLDNRRTPGAQKEAMQAGSRLHRKIQKKMGAGYRAEVSLKKAVREEEFALQVEGRADGIFSEPAGMVIDEIKCVYMDLNRLSEPDPIHLAQAKCYAYLYGDEHGAASMGVQITYCSIETEEIRRFRRDFSLEELSEWFGGLIHEYLKWARYLYHHKERRNQSLRDLSFPYPYRKGQKGLAAAVYRAIEKGEDLMIQAPTGIGKTLSTIFPSLKAMGEGMGDKLFYLTAKTITRSVAQEAFRVLREKEQLYFSTVTLTAKEKMCVLDVPDCNPVSCPAAKGHFDRVNDAVFEIIHQEFLITREKILEYARRFRVCPFEFCLDISSWVDGIICDYNYVFDPNVRLKRYFSEGNTGMEYLFLIDEAHNLVSRAREMYSAALVKEDLLSAKRVLKAQPDSAKASLALERCNRRLLALKRAGDEEGRLCRVHGTEYRLLEDVKLLALDLSAASEELDAYLNQHLEFADRDLVLDLYFRVRDFLYIHERMDDSWRIYCRLLGDGSFMVKLMCINPASSIRECLEQGRSALFFSATLLPIRYYKELLAGDQETLAVYADSPFPRENKLILTARDVSSAYKRRNSREYGKVAGYIREIVSGKKGNYMVFFPSYQYLEAVEQVFQEQEEKGEKPEFFRMVQGTNMSEEEREQFLAAFEVERDSSMAAFCVLGGIFSEGIDLTEEKLIGAIIVGTGLPQMNPEQEILREYFELPDGKGFAYAYQYPGMNKVLQAAGRVIRTAADRGIIALLDDRFLREDYLSLFPREWDRYTIVDSRNVGEAVRAFWEQDRAGAESTACP